MKTVRVGFDKTGRAKYMSHLDLMRTMTRALRRAELPIWYTEGFNRHPYITFAAPLSLGYESRRELMDFRLEEELDDQTVVDRLNAVMPEGLRVISCGEAKLKPGELAAARWQLVFDCPVSVIEGLLAQESIVVEKRTKKKQMKQMDIRPLFTDVVVGEEDGDTILDVTLPCSGETTVNPGLVLTALQQTAGNEAIACRICRLDLLAKDGTSYC